MKATPPETVLELHDVAKRYPKGQGMVDALQGVTLCIERGEHVALVGPSGAGKSTLLYLMGLMDVPTAGQLKLLGRETTRLTDAERSRLRGRTVGFVFQSFNLLPHLSAWRNVALPLRYAGVSRHERRARALEMLGRVGLGDRAEHMPSELSGGQEQRVAIARALVIRPQLLLADEPTGNLDSDTGARILDLLGAVHAQGATLVTVTHSAEVAQRAQRTVRLHNGRVEEDTQNAARPAAAERGRRTILSS
jgi:putative ABC transport system ATP-binding protein